MGFYPNISKFEYCKNSSKSILEVDQACLNIFSDLSHDLTLWAQSAECEKCNFLKVTSVPAYSTISIVAGTNFLWNFEITSGSNTTTCNASYKFTEYGQYSWNITDEACSPIHITEAPSQPYIPIVALLALIFGLSLLWKISYWAYNSEWLARLWPGNGVYNEMQSDLGSPGSTPDWEPPTIRTELSPIRRTKRRVYSVDTFRGLCIVLMIFVNYGGGQYWFFKHSRWNGITVADLIYPWFLWIMGTSIALSYRNQLRSGVTRCRLLSAALRRSLSLVAIGVALNTAGCHGDIGIGDIRLPGVLQRIGITYGIVATMEAALMKAQGSFQVGRWVVIQDLLESWAQWLVVLALVGCHTLLTFRLEVPGCRTGYLGPGGDHFRGKYANCTGGAAGYIDRAVFGSQHLYQHPTSEAVYRSKIPFDPEGLLGTLSAVLTVYLGVQSGRIMVNFNYRNQRISRWSAWAILTGLIAALLCDFSKNGGIIPMNKNLWSLSFALGMSSFAFIVQIVLYVIVDDKRWWDGTPLNAAGMNAILLYVGHELTRHMFPWSWRPYYRTHWEYTMMNAWGAALWLFIAHILHHRKMYLTL